MTLPNRAATSVLFMATLAGRCQAQEWMEVSIIQKFFDHRPQAREARGPVAIAEAEVRGRSLHANSSADFSRESDGLPQSFQAGAVQSLAEGLRQGTHTRAAHAKEQSVLGQAIVPRALGSDLPVYRPSDDESGKSNLRAVENPTGRISLRDVMALTLMQSPELAAFAWEIRAREARILQVSSRPNPVISTLVEEFGGASRVTGPGITGLGGVIQPQTTIQLGQLIELGGKRAARQSLVALSRDLATWDYETARIDVLTRVTKAFLDVLASQQAVALAEQTNGVVEQVQQAVGLRVVAGVVSPIEQTRADVALAAVRIESDRARRTLDADKRRLAALWGSSSARFESAVGDLTVLPYVPAFAELQERLSQNPELARWAAEIAQREAALVHERSKRVPDVTVSGGYRRFTQIGGSAFAVGVSIPLPLFDRNRGGIQEARDRVSKASEEQRAAQVRVTTMLADAYRALSSAKDEVTALAANVLPGTRSAFEGVTEGYRFGKFGFLEVLDAQRTLVSVGGQYLRALSNYHQAAAEVERLIGAPLTGAASLPPGDIK